MEGFTCPTKYIGHIYKVHFHGYFIFNTYSLTKKHKANKTEVN